MQQVQQFSLAYVPASLVNYWRSIVKRIMNRTPRNFGQSFSAAAVVGVPVVTEVVIIVVIVVVGVGLIMASGGMLLKFPEHDVMHIYIVTFNGITAAVAF